MQQNTSSIVGGVGITPPSDRFNNICLDYLTITFQYNDYNEYLKSDILYESSEYLNISNYEIINTKKVGFYGYKRKFMLGEHMFYQDELRTDPALSIFSKMIEISGAGCRDLERRNVDLVKLFSWIKKRHGTITRFDIAYDDFKGEYSDMFKISRFIDDGHYVSAVQTIEEIKQSKCGLLVGHGITFGTRSGSKQLQIYNKLLERKVNYEIDSDFIDFWIRYEIRFRQKIANQEFEKYIDVIKIEDFNNRQNEIKKFYFSRLLNMLDIKVKSKAINKSELATVDWWKLFCNNYDKIEIRNQYKLESDITKKKSWVKRSVIKPLAKIVKAVGDRAYDDLIKMCEDKATEFKEKDFLEIENYKKRLEETGELEDWGLDEEK